MRLRARAPDSLAARQRAAVPARKLRELWGRLSLQKSRPTVPGRGRAGAPAVLVHRPSHACKSRTGFAASAGAGAAAAIVGVAVVMAVSSAPLAH